MAFDIGKTISRLSSPVRAATAQFDPLDVFDLSGQKARDKALEEEKKNKQLSNTLSGKAQELTGQSASQTGLDTQFIKGQQKELIDQSPSNPTIAAMMNQKSGAVANAFRQQQMGGTKGPAAAMAADTIARQRDQDIAAALYGQRAQAINNYKSTVQGIGQTNQAYDLASMGLQEKIPQKQGLLQGLFSVDSIFS